MGQTVNLLVYTFGGSNPSLPTSKTAPANPHFLCEVADLIGVNAEVAQLIEH